MVASVPSPEVLDRYVVLEEIASGGMATVHLGRVVGAAGFARAVAIKRLHPQFARDPEFVSMLIDEARLAARVLHPNVVATLDVVNEGRELFLVMEYVAGCALSTLLESVRADGERIPPPVAIAIISGVLFGLHAAHEATTEAGEPLCIVHRDVSPQNVLIGVDGVPRVHDFGIAKAVGRVQHTREGQLKGKLRYMAPEQLRGDDVERRADIYSAAVVLWETLTNQRLFTAPNDAALFGKVLEGVVAPPSQICPDLPQAVDGVLLRALDRDPAKRHATARELALELTRVVPPASALEVGELVTRVAGDQAPKSLPPLATQTKTRTLPAGLLSSPALELKPRRLADAGFEGKTSVTRTETVQRAHPFPADQEPASATGALISTVAPARARRALGGIVALVVGASIAVALALVLWPTPEAPPALGFALRAAKPTFAETPASEPSVFPPESGDAVEPRRDRPPARSTKPRATGKSAPKSPDCKTLYVEDPTGIRRVKRECL
jgi:serine/threonine protein kinase